MNIRRHVSWALSLVFLTVAALEGHAETRVALVIGNGAYKNVPQLINPANDAADVSAALKRVGFDTISATDLDKVGMENAIVGFARAARSADIALFYYSGHALQFGGVNYLAPIDTKLTDEADLHRLVRLDEIVNDLQQAKNLRILVLDACRDNPFAKNLKRSIGHTRALPLQSGLAKIETPKGMIVAYATQAGQIAEDGVDRNSPYTSAFLQNIEMQDEIGTIFRRITAKVYETTKHHQLPELSLSLIGEFYLRGKVDPEPTARADFDAADRVNTLAGWDAFLKKHPQGLYAALANERRNVLIARTGPATSNVASVPLKESIDIERLKSEQRGDPVARDNLGNLHERGTSGLLEDQREAVRLYKLSADQGDAQGQANLASAYARGVGGLPKDEREAVRLYKLSADQGNAQGQANLGFAHARGLGGLPKDEREAVRLYKLSADQGDAQGQANLASAYARGVGGLPKDEREAVRLYKLSADQGNAQGQANLGSAYARGVGGLPKDEREAVRLYKLSADQGNAQGQANLGFAHARGLEGLPKDEREAVRLYKLSADQGDAQGQANLASAYVRGLGGLPKDEREAVRLYKLSADRGNAQGQGNLGFAYARGLGGLPKDEREAVRLYKLSADQGDAQGQANLGFAYARGLGGLPKDEREAVRQFKLSADQGNAQGQANLGSAYERGLGGLPKDEREAVRLYKLSADQGNALGQANLASAYERGIGVSKKPQRSHAPL